MGIKLYLCANSLHFQVMETIKLKDLTFKPYIRREEIASAIKHVAEQINKDLAGKSPLFLCVLNGAFVFAADLFREIDIPDAEITFIRMKSYIGTHSTGEVQMISGLHEDISGRTVVIVHKKATSPSSDGVDIVPNSSSDYYTTIYMHLSSIAVSDGAQVQKGQVIGNAGGSSCSNGVIIENAYGAHLHFEIRYKDEYINPEKIMEF